MKPQSAKAKGRNLQKYVVARILNKFTTITSQDVTSRSMGAAGEDLLISPFARQVLPISIECKNKKAFAIYRDYTQAIANSGKHEPVLIIKQNNSKPLAIVDLDFFLDCLYEKTKAPWEA